MRGFRLWRQRPGAAGRRDCQRLRTGFSRNGARTRSPHSPRAPRANVATACSSPARDRSPAAVPADAESAARADPGCSTAPPGRAAPGRRSWAARPGASAGAAGREGRSGCRSCSNLNQFDRIGNTHPGFVWARSRLGNEAAWRIPATRPIKTATRSRPRRATSRTTRIPRIELRGRETHPPLVSGRATRAPRRPISRRRATEAARAAARRSESSRVDPPHARYGRTRDG